MESNEDSSKQQEKSTRSAAEIRRRKLLLNSEDRMKKIVGFNNSDTRALLHILITDQNLNIMLDHLLHFALITTA